MSPDVELWRVYTALWMLAERTASVSYAGIAPAGESGWFYPNHDDPDVGPVIKVVRPYYRESPMPSPDRVAGAPLPAPDLLEELCTLAHEYGHSCDWQQAYVGGYEDAVQRMRKLRDGEDAAPLTDAEKELIMSEERRAWARGREALVTVGFTRWAEFDRRETEALAIYEEILDVRGAA